MRFDIGDCVIEGLTSFEPLPKIKRILILDAFLLYRTAKYAHKPSFVDLQRSEVVAGQVLVDPHAAGVLRGDDDHPRCDEEWPVPTEEPLTGDEALLEDVEDLEKGQIFEIGESVEGHLETHLNEGLALRNRVGSEGVYLGNRKLGFLSPVVLLELVLQAVGWQIAAFMGQLERRRSGLVSQELVGSAPGQFVAGGEGRPWNKWALFHANYYAAHK